MSAALVIVWQPRRVDTCQFTPHTLKRSSCAQPFGCLPHSPTCVTSSKPIQLPVHGWLEATGHICMIDGRTGTAAKRPSHLVTLRLLQCQAAHSTIPASCCVVCHVDDNQSLLFSCPQTCYSSSVSLWCYRDASISVAPKILLDDQKRMSALCT